MPQSAAMQTLCIRTTLGGEHKEPYLYLISLNGKSDDWKPSTAEELLMASKFNSAELKAPSAIKKNIVDWEPSVAAPGGAATESDDAVTSNDVEDFDYQVDGLIVVRCPGDDLDGAEGLIVEVFSEKRVLNAVIDGDTYEFGYGEIEPVLSSEESEVPRTLICVTTNKGSQDPTMYLMPSDKIPDNDEWAPISMEELLSFEPKKKKITSNLWPRLENTWFACFEWETSDQSHLPENEQYDFSEFREFKTLDKVREYYAAKAPVIPAKNGRAKIEADPIPVVEAADIPTPPPLAPVRQRQPQAATVGSPVLEAVPNKSSTRTKKTEPADDAALPIEAIQGETSLHQHLLMKFAHEHPWVPEDDLELDLEFYTSVRQLLSNSDYVQGSDDSKQTIVNHVVGMIKEFAESGLDSQTLFEIILTEIFSRKKRSEGLKERAASLLSLANRMQKTADLLEEELITQTMTPEFMLLDGVSAAEDEVYLTTPSHQVVIKKTKPSIKFPKTSLSEADLLAAIPDKFKTLSVAIDSKAVESHLQEKKVPFINLITGQTWACLDSDFRLELISSF